MYFSLQNCTEFKIKDIIGYCFSYFRISVKSKEMGEGKIMFTEITKQTYIIFSIVCYHTKNKVGGLY